MDAKQILGKIKTWLAGLSFRTGVIVLLSCIPFYILSFAQMALPISVEAKGVLWFILLPIWRTNHPGSRRRAPPEGLF